MRPSSALGALGALLLTTAAVAAQSRPATVIQGATVFDGSGADGRVLTVRIEGDAVAALGREAEAMTQSTDRVIEAAGLVLMPGFVDTHSHHDIGLFDEPLAEAAISQGITTIVVGQDGGSSLPVGRFLRGLDRQPAAVNVATFVGHGTIRAAVMRDDFERAATEDEVERMVGLVEQAMRDGALGLSSGLEYDPGIYSTTDEVVALAKAVARHDGRYVSHMRSEDRQVLEALDELIEIGRRAEIPVQASHLKLAMKSLHGRANEVIARLQAARDEGIEVSADVYPYDAWQSTMTVLFPERDFDNRETAAFALRELAPPDGFRLSRWAPQPELVGRTLDEIARARKVDPVDLYLDLLAEAAEWRQKTGASGESIIARSMSQQDIEELYTWKYTNVSSDGALADRHPRGAGSFPRFFAMIVREAGAVTLAEASHKTSALAARNVGLTGKDGQLLRGVIRVGGPADLVLFDAETVRDRATFEEPSKTSLGIVRVWVNGRTVWDRGRATGERPGRALRRAGVRDPHDPQVITALDDVFSDHGMGGTHAPGCALGVVRDGRLEFSRGYGMANLEARTAIDSKTVFRIGSVSKQFTAATVALLHLRGALDIDVPIKSYLANLPEWGNEVTTRQLIHHTSGVRDYLTLMFLAGKRGDDFYTDAEASAMIERQQELNFEPGAEFLYSNSGYFLMSQIVQRVTGRSLRAVADELIFEPLGMSDTHFHDDHAHVVAHRANGYAESPGQHWRQSMTTLDMVGDGGVFSNVEDMSRWARELLEPRVLGAPFHDLIRTRQPLRGGDSKGSDNGEPELHPYAFGITYGEHRGLETLGHGGAFVGYRANMTTWPSENLATVVLCNRADAWSTRLAQRTAEVLLGARMEPEKAQTAREPELLSIGQDSTEIPPPAAAADARPYVGRWYSAELDVT